MHEDILISEKFFCDGVEVLRVRIALVKNNLYGEAARRAFAYCSGELFRIAREEYLASDDPKKRFRYPAYLYSLTSDARYGDGKQYVTLRASLRRRGERGELCSYSDTHVWEGDEMCPPERKVKSGKKGKN